MKYLFSLTFLLSSGLSVSAGEVAAPELLQLEAKLTAEQEAKQNGSVSPEQYQAFLAEFRSDLKETGASIPSSSENAAAHARILVLLGENSEAVAGPNRELKKRPGDAALRISLGRTQLEKKDYAGALAAANEVLKTDPTNQNALFLKHQSLGRGSPSVDGELLTTAVSPSPAAVASAGSQVGLIDQAKRNPIVIDVPGIIQDSSMPDVDRPSPLWPLAAPFGIGLIGYGVYRNQRKEPDESSAYEVDRGGRAAWGMNEALANPVELTQEHISDNRKKLKVAAVSVAVAVTAVYGIPWAGRALPAVVTTVKAAVDRSGHSLQQITASELGAVGSDGYAAIQKARTLLNAKQAVIDPRKLTEYALSTTSRDGLNKARVFKSALGYSAEHADELIAQVRRGILSAPATPGLVDRYGVRMTVDLLIVGPAGEAVVRTGWIYLPGSMIPKLTTIFVK